MAEAVTDTVINGLYTNPVFSQLMRRNFEPLSVWYDLVNHKYEKDVPLGKTMHGTKCFGCGDVPQESMGEHEYDEEKWVSNNDSTFTRDETESNFCIVCGYEITRDIDSTADYDVHFEEYQFLRDLMGYIEMLLDIIYGSIKR